MRGLHKEYVVPAQVVPSRFLSLRCKTPSSTTARHNNVCLHSHAIAPSNGSKPCSVGQRVQLLGNGVLNLALAAGKFTGAAGVEVGSSGIGTALALYGVYSGAGNLTSGLISNGRSVFFKPRLVSVSGIS
jgi:hypothetical protein